MAKALRGGNYEPLILGSTVSRSNDARSRAYDVRALLAAPAILPPLRSFTWPNRYVTDRGQKGRVSATAHPRVGSSTRPTGRGTDRATPDDASAEAYEVYKAARPVDEWPGDDYDGTSVLAGAKVMVDEDAYQSYWWAFNIDSVLLAIAYVGPVVLGIPGWTRCSPPDLRAYSTVRATSPEVNPHPGNEASVSALVSSAKVSTPSRSYASPTRGAATTGSTDVFIRGGGPVPPPRRRGRRLRAGRAGPDALPARRPVPHTGLDAGGSPAGPVRRRGSLRPTRMSGHDARRTGVRGAAGTGGRRRDGSDRPADAGPAGARGATRRLSTAERSLETALARIRELDERRRFSAGPGRSPRGNLGAVRPDLREPYPARD